jgi:hypothetical protein
VRSKALYESNWHSACWSLVGEISLSADRVLPMDTSCVALANIYDNVFKKIFDVVYEQTFYSIYCELKTRTENERNQIKKEELQEIKEIYT